MNTNLLTSLISTLVTGFDEKELSSWYSIIACSPGVKLDLFNFIDKWTIPPLKQKYDIILASLCLWISTLDYTLAFIYTSALSLRMMRLSSGFSILSVIL